MVMGIPETRISGSESFFVVKSQSESKLRIGEGRRRCRVPGWGRTRRWRGMYKGHFQVPRGMAVRGGRRQSACHRSLACHENMSIREWT